MASDNDLLSMHNNGYGYQAIAEHYRLNKDSVRSRVSRATRTAAKIIQDAPPTPLLDELAELRREIVMLREQLNEQEDERLYGHDLGKPWRLDGDFVIVGDVHVSTTNWKFAQRPLQIAMKYLEKPRRLIIAGDIINGDAFSSYENVIPLPSFGIELKAARNFIERYLEVFDEIYLFLGNHDRRVQKGTNNAIEPEDLLRLISHDTRVKISHWGHCIIKTLKGEWRALHGSEYSVNQLVVADQLAQKYGQHIIGHHQHHLAIGWSRYKQYVIVDNGGLFDQDSMAYVQLDDNKRPRMANGFTLLKNGTPYLFGTEPFTDYNYWLGETNELRKVA
jgi:predicted phosphodiesterase